MHIYRPPFYGVYTTLPAPALRYIPTIDPTIYLSLNENVVSSENKIFDMSIVLNDNPILSEAISNNFSYSMAMDTLTSSEVYSMSYSQVLSELTNLTEVFFVNVSTLYSENLTTSETIPKDVLNVLNDTPVLSEVYTVVFSKELSEINALIDILFYTSFNSPWSLTYRNVKGTPLTFTEMDDNFTRLNSYKLVTEETSIVSSATITPNSSFSDYYVSALAVSATVAAPSGTPKDGQTLLVKINDNGTAQSLSWNVIYRVVGITLPTITTPGSITMIAFIYNGADSKWDSVSST